MEICATLSVTLRMKCGGRLNKSRSRQVSARYCVGVGLLNCNLFTAFSLLFITYEKNNTSGFAEAKSLIFGGLTSGLQNSSVPERTHSFFFIVQLVVLSLKLPKILIQ